MKKIALKVLMFTLALILTLPLASFANNGRGNSNKKATQPGPPSHAPAIGLRQKQDSSQPILLSTSKEETLINDEINDSEEVSDNNNTIIDAVVEDNEKSSNREKQQYPSKNSNGLNGLLRALENVKNTPAYSVISQLVELRGYKTDDLEEFDADIEKQENDMELDSKEILKENDTTDFNEEEIDYKATVIEAINLTYELEDELNLALENYILLLKALL